jgi:hypothetical protein
LADRHRIQEGRALWSQTNAPVVRALFEAFNEAALDWAAGMVTEDFTLLDVAAGQTLHGPAGCRQWLEGREDEREDEAGSGAQCDDPGRPVHTPRA